MTDSTRPYVAVRFPGNHVVFHMLFDAETLGERPADVYDALSQRVQASVREALEALGVHDSVGEPEAEATTDVVRPAESTVLEESGATDEPPSPADTPTSPGSLCTAPNGPNETTVSDTLACRPLTTCEVREIVLTGPPRWGEKHAWIVQDGPPYYKQLAGPFSARRDALDALAEIVNDAGSTPGPSGRCREY